MFICLFLHQTTTVLPLPHWYQAVFICLFLHQTTTSDAISFSQDVVFICLFLHQTTTHAVFAVYDNWCLSVYSYIKPQHLSFSMHMIFWCLSVYSYIKPQLSPRFEHRCRRVFICLFLHQTTTVVGCNPSAWRCLSVYSYIKPQLLLTFFKINLGVYLSIPTSNHNSVEEPPSTVAVFICLFLHQTTTSSKMLITLSLVFICLFLHQTTTYH